MRWGLDVSCTHCGAALTSDNAPGSSHTYRITSRARCTKCEATFAIRVELVQITWPTGRRVA